MTQFIRIDRKPNATDADGTYKLIKDGKYWGTYYVGVAWIGERFVAEADPRDGKPW